MLIWLDNKRGSWITSIRAHSFAPKYGLLSSAYATMNANIFSAMNFDSAVRRNYMVRAIISTMMKLVDGSI